MLKFAPANPGNPFQAEWRADLERTDYYERPDSAPPMLHGDRDSHAVIAGMLMDISNLSGIPVKVLTGESRRRNISRWRSLGYCVGMRVLGKSSTQVGIVFNRDSSSVSEGARRFAWLCEGHPEWLDRYEKIARGLQ